jgi:HK97 gp10 family phage protein
MGRRIKMAYFKIDGVQEIAKELEALAVDIDDIAMKMVKEAAEIYKTELSTAIRDNTQKYGTGTLANSISYLTPRRNDLGMFTVVTARGKDSKGKKKKTSKSYAINSHGTLYDMHRLSYGSSAIRNQDKLWYLENGNSHQAPKPIMAKCIRRAEPRVLSKMQAVFNYETRKQ